LAKSCQCPIEQGDAHPKEEACRSFLGLDGAWKSERSGARRPSALGWADQRPNYWLGLSGDASQGFRGDIRAIVENARHSLDRDSRSGRYLSDREALL